MPEVQEMPAPTPELSSFTRSEMVGVLKILLQKNRSLEQAIALAIVQQFAPAFARDIARQLDQTLHPQFREIISALQPPVPKRGLFGRRKEEGEAV